MLSIADKPVIRNQRAPDKRQHYTSPEPKRVLKDYLTVDDLNFVLNLLAPNLPF